MGTEIIEGSPGLLARALGALGRALDTLDPELLEPIGPIHCIQNDIDALGASQDTDPVDRYIVLDEVRVSITN